MLSNGYDSLKRHIANGGLCSGDMVQLLANASKDFDASIDDSNSHSLHSQKTI